jgi:hypothetical protein
VGCPRVDFGWRKTKVRCPDMWGYAASEREEKTGVPVQDARVGRGPKLELG